MADASSTPPQDFVVKTASLYARAGFDGGDLLRPAFPTLGAGDLRALLVGVLHHYVIPVLDQSVQTLQIPTGHNPLRAASVDGVSVRWTTAEHGNGPPLTPATVTVTMEQVLAAAKRLRIAVVPASASASAEASA